MNHIFKLRIDIKKSIQKEKIVYFKSPWYFVNVISLIIGLLPFLVLSIVLIITLFSAILSSNILDQIFNSLWLSICLLLSSNLFIQNKVIKLKETDQNLDIFIEALKRHFDAFLIDESDSEMITISNSAGWISYKWKVVIIHNADKILLHRTELTRFNIIVPWLAVSNYLKCRRLAKQVSLTDNKGSL